MYNTLISANDLLANLDKKNWVIVDCRFSLADTAQGEQAYAHSRLPRAQYAHLEIHLSSTIILNVTGRHPVPDKTTLATQFCQWGINDDTQIIAYDDKAGAIAARLWWLCQWLGHKGCAVLEGGFANWKASNLPIETGQCTSPPKGQFVPKESLTKMVMRDDVLNPAYQLIDAREPARYRGEHEPIDPVAGHIPGAINLPFTENLDSEGQFISRSALAQRFDSIANEKDGKSLVHYCGSGVTAAHNMLAMTHAGIDPGALYVGSFSEWITPSTDGEQFPVARQGD